MRVRSPVPVRTISAIKADQDRDDILRAAFRLVGALRDQPVSVQQILEAANLSTRAFYRHFRSKDELIITMYRTAAERVAVELAEVVAAAPGPVEALRAYIHHHLAVVYEVRRARQTSVLNSSEARAAAGFDRATEDDAAHRRELLAAVIADGRRSGVFSSATDPQEDARAVISVVGGLIQARIAGHDVPTWEAATEHVTALFLRSFGASSVTATD